MLKRMKGEGGEVTDTLNIWNYAMLFVFAVCVSYITNKCQVGCLDIIEHQQLYLV